MPSEHYFYPDNLVSERLKSRFWTIDDLPAWSEFYTYREAVELYPPQFLDPRRQLERQMERYAQHTFGLQAIIHKGTNEFLGQCGLLLQEVDGLRELEVGYHFIRRYWGNGYAPEAAKMFIDYAFANDLAPSVISIIDVRNTNSQRVAEKNGLKKEKETVWNGIHAHVYRVFK